MRFAAARWSVVLAAGAGYRVDDGPQVREMGAMKMREPSTSRVTVRMPSWLLAELEREANRRDVPYQSPLKMALADWLRQQTAG